MWIVYKAYKYKYMNVILLCSNLPISHLSMMNIFKKKKHQETHTTYYRTKILVNCRVAVNECDGIKEKFSKWSPPSTTANINIVERSQPRGEIPRRFYF